MKHPRIVEVSPRLDEISRFFKFGRKAIREEIVTSLTQLDDEISELQQTQSKLSGNVAQLSEVNQKHVKTISILQNTKNKLTGNIHVLTDTNQEATKQIAVLQNSKKVLTSNVQKLTDKNQEAAKQITVLQNSKKALTSNVQELTDTNQEATKQISVLQKDKKILTSNVQELRNSSKKQEISITKLTDENESKSEKIKSTHNKLDALDAKYSSVSEKFELVSNILSAKPHSEDGLFKFKDLLYGDFVEFANNESSLAEEAKALLMLQAIEKDLELIVSFPAVHSKSIIAIGGGFSSGKSAFVSSFFKTNDIELPIGIEPVTAIPTYVISGAENSINGFSNNGGVIDIDSKLYKSLSHNFVKSFNFNLKNIMPFMTICTPLDQEFFKNICLIDTPGYNPADTDGFTGEDDKTAFEYLEKAGSLIWMIGLDSNGTIPASDLDFLNNLNLSGKKLLIVANKADLRADSDLKDILEEIAESLDDYDIDFAGISAYSANSKKEYLHIEESLNDFLKNANSPVKIERKIISRINFVFDMYKKAIEKDIAQIDKIKSSFKSLELDLIENGFESDDNKIDSRISKLKNSFTRNELDKQKKIMSSIRKQMTDSVSSIFDAIK